jgi:hypothetical protein
VIFAATNHSLLGILTNQGNGNINLMKSWQEHLENKGRNFLNKNVLSASRKILPRDAFQVKRKKMKKQRVYFPQWKYIPRNGFILGHESE